MAEAPAVPWVLRCAWCSYHIEVNARGGRGQDEGAGVEAAHVMQWHVMKHGRTWREFLEATDA
jgi:hypothetical protein